MLITCILKDGVVYLPTVAKTEAGFYMDREPVGPNSCKALRSGPSRRTKGPTESPYRKDPTGGPSWVEDRDHKIDFPPGTTADEAFSRMIAILRDAARR